MKIIFAGTPEFAAKALESLLETSHEVIAVLTQPDRPAGRGMQLIQSPVKQLALRHGIVVMQPLSLKPVDVQHELEKMQADVMVVAAYGLILPSAVLKIPRYGCLNIHASLLPRWRGAAPIQRAMLAGDTETGITIMQMDEGLDTGAMLLKKSCAITPQDTAQTLHDKLAALGATAIVETLENLHQQAQAATVQDASQASYASKIVKAEAQIDWNNSATQIELAIRAYNPVPIAFCSLNGTTLKIWKASQSEGPTGEPGKVLSVSKQGIQVACGQGAVNLEVLQRPNAKALPAAQFIQGFAVKAGDRFATH